MAKGLYLTRDGRVLVDYGKRQVPISPHSTGRTAIDRFVTSFRLRLCLGRTSFRLYRAPEVALPGSPRQEIKSGIESIGVAFASVWHCGSRRRLF